MNTRRGRRSTSTGMKDLSVKRIGRKSDATEFRNLVTVQDLTRVSDGQGGNIQNWIDRKPKVWAAINPIKAVEREQYKTQDVYATHLIKFRGRIDIDDSGDTRIYWNGRTFRIMTVEDLQERGIVKFITAEEIRNVGTKNL